MSTNTTSTSRLTVMEVNKMPIRTDIIVQEKHSNISVELQYGEQGKPFELVITDKFWKDAPWTDKKGNARPAGWNHSTDQVRMEITDANIKALKEAIAKVEMAEKTLHASKPMNGAVTVMKGKTPDKMSDDELQANMQAMIAEYTARQAKLASNITKTRKGK